MDVQTNLVLDTVSLVILLLIADNCRNEMIGARRSDTIFTWMMLCCTAIALLDIFGRVMLGRTGGRNAQTLYYSDITAILVTLTVCSWLWLEYTICWLQTGKSVRRSGVRLLPMFAEFFLLILNFFNGWLFRIDGAGTFARGRWYAFNLVVFLLYLGWATAVAVCSDPNAPDRREKRREAGSIMSFPLLPLCGAVAATVLPDISLFAPTISLSLLMIYLNVQRRRHDEDKLSQAQLEKKLAEDNVAMMRSQLQPHFLYNLLSVVVYYCTRDPEHAKDVTLAFSEYLRENMNSLNENAPVEFFRELDHVKHYLYLEQQRFEEFLAVKYNIEATEFSLPSMTVQPLVQNAVNHGLGSARDGGTVTLSTREYPDRYEVVVTDDGIGFDPESAVQDEEHIGILNVRRRLTKLSHGTLAIQSAVGQGTTATITIPKEVAENAHPGSRR